MRRQYRVTLSLNRLGGTPMKRHLALAAIVAALLIVGPLGAAEITPSVPTCVPADGNAVVSATLSPQTGWSNVRVYFREAGAGPFYFLEMRADGNGNFWAALPKPKTETETVDVYMVGTLADGSEVRTTQTAVPVLGTCVSELTRDQNIYAQNLVVGETVVDQQGKEVVGFRCDGIVSRIVWNGDLRSDNECRREMLAAATGEEGGRRKWLIPLAIIGAGGAGAGVGAAIVSDENPPDCSACIP